MKIVQINNKIVSLIINIFWKRYWNSSAAYGLMEYCTKNNKKLPEIDDSVYFWPMDLQKPNFVIFLTLSEEERKRRIMLRNKEPTKDEIRISNSSDICEM